MTGIVKTSLGVTTKGDWGNYFDKRRHYHSHMKVLETMDDWNRFTRLNHGPNYYAWVFAYY